MILKGARAVVTGASSGIGEATATLLAARGAHVVLIARNRVRLGAVAQHLRKSGGTADVCAGDLADTVAVASLARAILEKGMVSRHPGELRRRRSLAARPRHTGAASDDATQASKEQRRTKVPESG